MSGISSSPSCSPVPCSAEISSSSGISMETSARHGAAQPAVRPQTKDPVGRSRRVSLPYWGYSMPACSSFWGSFFPFCSPNHNTHTGHPIPYMLCTSCPSYQAFWAPNPDQKWISWSGSPNNLGKRRTALFWKRLTSQLVFMLCQHWLRTSSWFKKSVSGVEGCPKAERNKTVQLSYAELTAPQTQSNF